MKPKNYRPVALTSHLVKVFEKVLRNKIVMFIEQHNLLNPNQHGFRSGRSCLSQLIQHYDKVTAAMEEGKNVDVIYLDFSKAFDKLDFDITLQKLHNIGVTEKVFRWIKNFIIGRKQTVSISGAKSSTEPVISGVPQGSVLGPLLFLIMLGDIDSNTMYSSVSSFADDTRVLGEITDINSVLNTQKDLNTIYLWADNNNAQFNNEKFECLRYGKDEIIKSSTGYTTSTGSNIVAKSSITDLGICMSSTGNFEDHIHNVVRSANLKCGWILRTFRTRSPELMLTLWKALVLPILDYCCQLWSPSGLGLMQALEKVQMTFLNKICGASELNYWQQLSHFNLYSLQRRRERYIAIYVWKVLENIVPNFGINVVTNARRGRLCIVPLVRASAPARMQTLRFNCITINGPRIFNSLPLHLKNVSDCSINVFKNELHKHLQSIPDEPRVRKLIPFCANSSNSLTVMKPNH